MAIRETTWRPDTCGCEIVYSWDDAVPANEHAHALERFTVKCAAHAGDDEVNLFAAALEENRRKNLAFDEIKKVIPALSPEFYLWEFDENRVLTISLNGPTNSEKGAVIAALNTRFGSGKIELK
jgi:hypothetical protein